jgi:hypothetical protein
VALTSHDRRQPTLAIVDPTLRRGANKKIESFFFFFFFFF